MYFLNKKRIHFLYLIYYIIIYYFKQIMHLNNSNKNKNENIY